MKKEHGFTLVEIIVTLAVGMVILAAIYSVINLTQRTSTGLERRVVAQGDARGALELMSVEIQMASYNPFSMNNIWYDATTANAACFTTLGNADYRGIQEATANAITIEMDIDGNGVIGNNTNEKIRYAYDPVNKYITRSTNCGGDEAFLGDRNVQQERKTVLVENNAAGIPVFRYYNGSGVQLAAPVTTEIPNIRRVEITLVTDTSNADIGSNTRRRIIYSTSVIPRNHFTLIY